MKTIFFCTGLSRMRSTWLANFFTHGESFCWHDATKDGLDAITLHSAFDKVNSKYVGDSDSGLLTLWEAARASFPDARWLIVRRDVKDALRAYRTYFKGRTYAGHKVDDLNIEAGFDRTAALEALEASLPDNQKIVVNYEQLDHKLVMHEIWNFLTPTNPWSDNRWDLLNTMQINIYPEKVRSKWLS